MTVAAALRELEKIEMIRGSGNEYHLDHAVTATQKTILSAFGMASQDIKKKAQAEVFHLKDKYDAAIEELNGLLKKKQDLQKQEILKAIEASPLSHDEIMRSSLETKTQMRNESFLKIEG